VRAATGQAGYGATNFSHAREIKVAVGTFVKKTSGSRDRGKGEIVRALLVADSKIDTSGTPFLAVRRDSAAFYSKLREEMRELVTKCAIDLGRMLVQLRIERDQFVTEVGATGTAL
jgi:hypothetical protein